MKIVTENARKKLFKAGYRIIGNHSAVKICHYTKIALNGGKFCYKRWYGIQSHRCIQMTPALQCNFNCIFCWRFHGIIPFVTELKWDEPSKILDGCIEEQRKLLSGFGGNPRTSKQMFLEAMEPKHVAISLDGEPTLYPKISELVDEIKKRGMTAFLVTNGTMPERLKDLLKSEPTNLYLSLYGTNEEMYKKICAPLISDTWEKINESLKLIEKFKCRTVIRLTLVKGLNMKAYEGFSELIKKAKPKFIECKGYTWVGESRQRLKESNVPNLEEIKNFAKKISEFTDYEIKAEDEKSRVVLLSLSGT
jgi:tRNA wybutosine-synthesizing protein 1